AAAVSDGAGGAITVWTDYRSSTYVEENQTYSDLYMQRINDQITSVKIPASSLNPESCVLYPAFPNPFNPKTTISYYIPAGGNAKITVYNIKSEIVLNLVNEYHPKGYFEKTWDASTCPSGIYFLKLTHRNNTQIAKCVLIK
nr:T9SS type A sorting domain-containing protein [FCB group bacterium]